MHIHITWFRPAVHTTTLIQFSIIADTYVQCGYSDCLLYCMYICTYKRTRKDQKSRETSYRDFRIRLSLILYSVVHSIIIILQLPVIILLFL